MDRVGDWAEKNEMKIQIKVRHQASRKLHEVI